MQNRPLRSKRNGCPPLAYLLRKDKCFQRIEPVVFVESTAFQRQRERHLSDAEYRELQNEILVRPSKGALIRGSGGLRKMRLGRSGRGKSGGFRVIYYHAIADSCVYLLDMYAKSKQAQLSPDQIKRINDRLKG